MSVNMGGGDFVNNSHLNSFNSGNMKRTWEGGKFC